MKGEIGEVGGLWVASVECRGHWTPDFHEISILGKATISAEAIADFRGSHVVTTMEADQIARHCRLKYFMEFATSMEAKEILKR